MNRTKHTFIIQDTEKFKNQLLHWSQQFEEIVWLDSNNDPDQQYKSYDAILAVDGFTSMKTSYQGAFERLEEYQQSTKDWLFGYLSYDLKNDIERLKSAHEDHVGFPDLYFFQPKRVFLLKGDSVEMQYLPMVDDEMDTDYEDIQNTSLAKNIIEDTTPLHIKLKIHKEAYKDKVRTLLQYIQKGDVYEANFCQEFYAHGTINPLQTYQQLNAISTPPFATFLKLEDHFLVSATPERYLKKEGSKLVSSPIKGTAARSEDFQEDVAFAKALSEDPKERSENIMIVDLVRNDLSRIAQKGSVTVEELCKVYSFKQVYQMISTVSAQIAVGISPVDTIQATFPMGSMTGAPKIRAMEIIEELEETKRGLYSGAVGYFTPDGDFDFNVIIRSILYNAVDEYISYSVGSAITAKSDPDKEYAECLLKAKAMREVLDLKRD
ncbi:aminodeoxychorismate synthase component I [uncultured Dokdonia sp.]|uniref:aminodeoxychorismate synthase component I n=1 Tax=uncultured Dokdonia sp. TaxID=575653 RepID=UPI002625D550|nr:aminodeoxychorismate synthase component I [uncultured Dokdonia sp.]